MHSHRALSVPDIIHIIFDEISDDKPALARSARSCRAFHDISLDILWKNLECVAPLQKLIPHHEIREDGTFAFISEDQWKRFDSYAQRVRTWGFHSVKIDTRLYIYLATIRPGVVSFPALRELQLFEHIEPPPIFVFPPSLRYLHINFSYWKNSGPRYGEQYLFTAIDQVPTLEALKLRGHVPLTSLARCAEFKCLHSLNLHGAELPPIGAMSLLSSLPVLTELELPETALESVDISPCMGFHQLEALTLSGHPSNIYKFLKAITTTKLHAVAIHNSPFDTFPGTFSEWSACFESIVDSQLGSSLRSVEIKAAVGHIDGKLSVIELLKPLMNLHQLEEFSLSGLVHELFIQDIMSMASAWPHLKRLTLDIPPSPIITDQSSASENDPSSNSSSTSTLQCLTYFACHCPKLIALNLTLADESLPPAVSQSPALPHGLEHLRLLIKTPFDYIHLARLVDRLFPTLVTVEVGDAFDLGPNPNPATSSSNPHLLNVPDFIRMLQAARRERCLT